MTIVDIPFKPYKKNRKKGEKLFEEYTLPDDLWIEQWIVPKGTVVKIATTKNFGFLALSKGTMDKRGFEIPRHLFKY